MANNYIVDISEIYNMINGLHVQKEAAAKPGSTHGGVPASTAPVGHYDTTGHWTGDIKLSDPRWNLHSGGKVRAYKAIRIQFGSAHHFKHTPHVSLAFVGKGHQHLKLGYDHVTRTYVDISVHVDRGNKWNNEFNHLSIHIKATGVI